MGRVLREPLRVLAGVFEDAAYAFLDCGIYEHGFARVRRDTCRAEIPGHLLLPAAGAVPVACRQRGALSDALLVEEVSSKSSITKV